MPSLFDIAISLSGVVRALEITSYCEQLRAIASDVANAGLAMNELDIRPYRTGSIGDSIGKPAFPGKVHDPSAAFQKDAWTGRTGRTEAAGSVIRFSERCRRFIVRISVPPYA